MSCCALCGFAGAWPLAWKSEDFIQQWRVEHGDTRPYGWKLCQRCGNGYPAFQPGLDLLAFYWNRHRQDREYDIPDDDRVWKVRQDIGRRYAERAYTYFAALVTNTDGRRFLDVGCGLGETVRYFAEKGWDALGIDADPVVERFHREIGIRSKIGQVEATAIEGKYDLIQIAHAIYFITDPRKFLESLKAKLTERGLVCIVISDFLASDGAGLPSFAHSFYPTKASLPYLLALCGYETILCRRNSGSIYVAARPTASASAAVHPRLIHLGFQTKQLRSVLFGKPHLMLRRLAKRLLRRSVS